MPTRNSNTVGPKKPSSVSFEHRGKVINGNWIPRDQNQSNLAPNKNPAEAQVDHQLNKNLQPNKLKRENIETLEDNISFLEKFQINSESTSS